MLDLVWTSTENPDTLEMSASVGILGVWESTENADTCEFQQPFPFGCRTTIIEANVRTAILEVSSRTILLHMCG